MIQMGKLLKRMPWPWRSIARKVQAAKPKKRQTAKERTSTTHFDQSFPLGRSSLVSTSMLMCLFSRVDKEAPKKATHRTKCRRKISAQGIPVEKKFRNTTCRKASPIMVVKKRTMMTPSVNAKYLSIVFRTFIFFAKREA